MIVSKTVEQPAGQLNITSYKDLCDTWIKKQVQPKLRFAKIQVTRDFTKSAKLVSGDSYQCASMFTFYQVNATNNSYSNNKQVVFPVISKCRDHMVNLSSSTKIISHASKYWTAFKFSADFERYLNTWVRMSLSEWTIAIQNSGKSFFNSDNLSFSSRVRAAQSSFFHFLLKFHCYATKSMWWQVF